MPETEPTGQKSAATVAGKQAPLKQKAVPDVDPDNPPEEFSEALEAEDFVVYGRASIEKFDKGGQNSPVPEILDMGALEDALGRFFNSEKAPGIISIGHDDIPIGRPLQEYEVPEATAIDVDGDTFEFDAGETITTHVEDSDDDGRPELWLVADLANDTDIARKARLGVLTGELDGFSVTFGRKDTDDEPGGRRVTDLDLFSVTIAPDEMIANEGAEFDLAGFKAEMDSYLPTARGNDAISPERGPVDRLAAVLTDTMRDTDTDTPDDVDSFLTKLGQKLTGSEGNDDEQSDEGQKTDEEDESGQKQPGGDEGGDTIEDLVRALADELDEDPDDLMQALGQAADDDDDDDDYDEEEEDDEDGMKADDNTEVTIDFGAKLEEHGVVTEDDLGEKMDNLRETIVDDVGEKLAETNEEAVEEIAQKMQQGSTPNPAGGSFQDSEDFETHLQEVSEKEGW